jgi:hypothetical protein
MRPSFLVSLAVWALATPAWAAEPLKPAPERFASADTQEVPSFQRHILPLMGKLGCNGRACHGSFQGQGGFRLSLFGYDFKADHEALLKGENPRIDLKEPTLSLALEKPTQAVPHKGGKRMDEGGWEYRMFLRWIEAGAKGVDEQDRRFERLEVTPTQIVFSKPGETAQLRVIAHWSDGSSEDVTPLSRFRTNNEAISDISDSGLVTAVGPGDTNVVVFYDNGVAPVESLLPVSELVGPRYPDVPTPTRVDALVVEKLRKLGIVPSEQASDAEFLRRVSLDMTGTLPSPAEIEAFLADTAADKRAKKVDELLERPTYAAWWATRLCDLTGNNAQNLEERNARNELSRQWYEWIYRRVQENTPYDKLVEGLVMAVSRRPGQDYQAFSAEMSAYCRKSDPADFTERPDMPHFWARRTFKDPAERALGFAYTFLGVRLQCAQCHKHPFDQWTQEDFNEFRDFFNPIVYGAPPDMRKEYAELNKAIGKDRKEIAKRLANGDPYPWKEVFVAAIREGDDGKGKAKGEKNRKRPQPTVVVTAKLLGGDNVELKKGSDPRELLMSWMRQKDNPYFARAFVNRVWAAYFNVGIIEPPDDLNLANPPSNAALLDYLAQGFVEHGYDMKWLHREIANSRTYQLSWKANDTNRLDERNFSHAVPRRLPAEVAYDAIQLATAAPEGMAAAIEKPQGRAIALGKSLDRDGKNQNSYALTVFGRPARLTNCDCERSNEASLLQTIYLRNDQEMLSTIEKSGWLRQLDREFRPAKNGKGQDENLEAALEKARQRLAKIKKDNAKNVKLLAQAEARVAQLEARLKEQPPAASGGEPAAEPAPMPVEQSSRLVREAYLRTVSRPPSDAELARSQEYLAAAGDPVAGIRDLLWALLNTKEFIVNH